MYDVKMIYMDLTLNQETIVFRVEDGPLDVFAGERANGLDRIPQGDQQKLRSTPGDTTQRIDAAVAGRGLIRCQARLVQVLEVTIRVLSRRPTAPSASDHFRFLNPFSANHEFSIRGVQKHRHVDLLTGFWGRSHPTPLIVLTGLGPVAADRHVAPATVLLAAEVQEYPAAGRSATDTQPGSQIV